MLKKVGFGLFALVLVSYAIDPFNEDFERPWNYEYKWPGNSSVVDYVNCFPFCPAWNINVIQATADGLATGSVEARYEDEKTAAAQANYTETTNIREQVNEFADYGVLAYVLNAEDVCQAGGIANCSCFFSGTYFACTNIQLDKEMRYRIATRIFSPSYSKAWKGTVDNALDSLEGKVATLNREMNSLEAKYQEVEYTGACASDVSGHESCENAANLLAAAQDGSTTWQYRNITEIRNVLDNNSIRIYDEVPMLQFGWIANGLGNESGGVIGEFVKTAEGLAGHYEQVKRTYSALCAETDAEISGAKAANSSAVYHELWRIRAGPSFAGVVGGDAMQVSALARSGSDALSSSVESKEMAAFAVMYQSRGYLRSALMNMTIAKERAIRAEEMLAQAADNAEMVTGAYEAKATEALGRVYSKFGGAGWTDRARALYGAAEKELESGRNELRLGRRFGYYVNAIEYADEAYSISPGAEADGNWSAIAACGRASDLISRADADGVDVNQERAYLSVLNRSTNASVLVAGCGEIIESVTLAAQYMYSHLGAAREEAVYLLGICGADCNDLVGLLEDGERMLVADGHVIYPDAIGSLGELEATYSRIRAGAVQSIVRQVGQYLTVRKTLYVGEVALDRPRAATLEVQVTNSVDYAGQNVEAVVESPLEFSIDDAVFGAEKLRGAAYLDGKLQLYIRDMGALASERFVFEKNQTVLRTVDVEEEAAGLEDYSALVAERREVECAAEIPGFYAEDYWENVLVDGMNSRLQDGYVGRGVSEGAHILEATYYVQDAYKMNVSENVATKIGNRVYYKYQVWFMPEIDMESLESFASLPASGYVREPRAITISGEKVDAVQTASGFALRLHDLVGGKTAKVEISYYVDNSSEYAAAEVGELMRLNLSGAALDAAEDAARRLAANDTAGAIESIQRAYELADEERVRVEKLQSEYSKYYGLVDGERARIRNALASGEFESQFRDLLSARADYLNDVIASLEDESLEMQVAALKEYDKTWLADQLRAFRKNASAQINGMYVAYLGGGVENDTLARRFSGLRERYLAFESSASLEDAYSLAMEIAMATVEVGGLESGLAAERAIALSEAQALRGEVSALLADYEDEYSAAKGTRFEGVFKIKPADAQAMLKQADADMKKGNASAVAGARKSLTGMKANLSEALDYLESLAVRTAKQAEEAVGVVSGMLSEKDAKEAARLSAEMEEYLAAGEFAKALKDANEMMAIAAAAEGGGRYDAILWLSAIFVGAVIVVYFFRERKGGKPEKILKKLEKAA